MVTTFTSRKLVRDELVALFTANNSWQAVYGYVPAIKVFAGMTPLLIIRSRGTVQDFAALETNPAEYRFGIASFCRAYSAGEITPAQAEDTLDTLDTVVRQVIRNSAGSMTTADNLRFDGESEVRDVTIEGLPYMVETRFVIAKLARGAI